MNDDRYRRGRRGPDRGADAGYRRRHSYEQEYDEEYWEDEEDYEEYARSMDREYEISDSRRQAVPDRGARTAGEKTMPLRGEAADAMLLHPETGRETLPPRKKSTEKREVFWGSSFGSLSFFF